MLSRRRSLFIRAFSKRALSPFCFDMSEGYSARPLGAIGGRGARTLYDPTRTMRILEISGSLRAESSNSTLLRALPLVAPPDFEFTFRDPLDALPFFNPDVEEGCLPPAVARWREEVRDHSALVICSPEYAHGIPGVLKNALDWLVGGTEITGKPIAVIQTSLPSTIAHASLVETLRVMGGTVVPEASVALTLRGRKLDANGIASDPDFSRLLRTVLVSLSAAAARR